MSKLINSTVYLAGAVEASDNPYSWRNIISERLVELQIIPWNPMVKPSWFPNISAVEQQSWKDMFRRQHSGFVSDPNYWVNNLKLREFCLHLIANANFVIVKLDKMYTVGTFFELALCKYKPVFVISEDPAISTWLIAELGITQSEYRDYFHENIESLMLYLSKINNGDIIPYNLMKWSFMTYENGYHA